MSYNLIEERCPVCRNQMMSTHYTGQAYCHSCRQYRASHYPWAGQSWGGIWISERCMYCGQPIVDTGNPNVNYCPYCSRYQSDRTGF